jgi:hypothetical protein
MGATQILAKSESKLIIESLDNSATRGIVHYFAGIFLQARDNTFVA